MGKRRVMCEYCMKKIRDEATDDDTITVIVSYHPKCYIQHLKDVGKLPEKDKAK